ncbi:uncharacterized protein A4U43_C03F14760 [Asparagus officinalis]|uniref:Uncharacterized protein n=1 Tax=Asparagus officinalis TaxID=4686 RepID=A0A5P1FA42_ASPOF|nr:uncharacterized protein A4U43_C03F14760 [Asparagus officinalis]
MWKYWIFPCCQGELLLDSERHMKHILMEHVGKLSEVLKPLLSEDNQNWVAKLVSNIVDGKIRKNLATSKQSQLDLERTCGMHNPVGLSYPLKSYMQEVGHYWVDKIVNGIWEPMDVQATTVDSDILPSSDDPERSLLWRICDHFRMHIKHNYFIKKPS